MAKQRGGIQATVAPDDIEFVRQMGKRYPFLIVKHWGGIVTWLKNRFRIMLEKGGGVYGVRTFPPKNKTTLALHGRRPFGGQIPTKRLAKAWKGEGGRQMVGIPDRIPAFRAFGESLQTSDNRPLSWRERAFLARVKAVHYDPLNPPRYERPARPFVAAFATHNEFPMIAELRRRMMKDMASEVRLQKARAQVVARASKAMRAGRI